MTGTVLIGVVPIDNHLTFTFSVSQDGLRRSFETQIAASRFRYANRQATLILESADGLFVIRELARRQKDWSFRFGFEDDTARSFVSSFMEAVKEARSGLSVPLKYSEPEVRDRLVSLGFERKLTEPQLRDLTRLASLSNGANFSVPGAGKTTVTLALNTLLRKDGDTLLVISPKSAFRAWEEIVDECFPNPTNEPGFVRLSGDHTFIASALKAGHPRFVINYEMATQHVAELRRLMMTRRVHLVIDESHRIKAGQRSLRGAVAMQLGTFAYRRDILSGTPMPQGASDIAAQADFLWPGVGIGRSIEGGASPSSSLSGLFVRTTKKELKLPEVVRKFEVVPMHDAQLALYSILRDRTIAQFSRASSDPSGSMMQMRASTIRLLQASVNPSLTSPVFGKEADLLQAAIDEGPSPKLLAAARIARQNAHDGRKTVIWTIFTDTLLTLKNMLIDLNAVAIYGGNTKGGEGDEIDRDVALDNFLNSKNCWVMVANAAAASEGLSLHKAAHEAIYVDRSYNAAHFLQSIDRIHRIGLDADTVTRITVLQSRTPRGIGNIDLSVSRRLSSKTANLEALLGDADLREIAMAEDDAPIPEDAEFDRDDVIDLIYELESGPRKLADPF